MSWCISHDEEGVDLVLFICGKRARRESGLLGKISSVQPGRNADELWVKFDGTETGQRLKRSMYRAIDDFSEKISTPMKLSNMAVIRTLEEEGYQTQKRKKTVKKAKRILMEQQVQVENSTVPDEEATMLKKIGKYNVGSYIVDTDLLQEAPKQHKTRPINLQWVRQIRESLQALPGKVLTRIPVNIMKPEIEEFNTELLNEPQLMYTLGGNHLVQAMKELLAENKNNNEQYNCLKSMEVEVYLNLPDEEALFLANWHNLRTKNKSVTFQDKVFLARNVYKQAGQNWKRKAVDVIGCLSKENCKMTSLGTVLSVASYNDEEYEAAKAVLDDYDITTTPGSSFPQNLFRELQGVKGDRLCYLVKARGTNGLKQARKCRMDKSLSSYKQAFTTLVQADSWEEAMEEYPEGCKKLKELAENEKAIKRKYIPKEMISLVDKCTNFESLEEEIKVEINITTKEKDITGKEEIEKIIQKHKVAILKEVKKNLNIIES